MTYYSLLRACLPSRSPRRCAPEGAMLPDSSPATLLRILAFHFLLKIKSYDLYSSKNLTWVFMCSQDLPAEIEREYLLAMAPSHRGTAHSAWNAAEHSIARPHLRKANFLSPEWGVPQTPLGCSDTIGAPLMARERNVNSVLQAQIGVCPVKCTESAASLYVYVLEWFTRIVDWKFDPA